MILNAKNKTQELDDKEIIDDISEEIYGKIDEKTDTKPAKIDITDTDVLATSFLFFVAGYETTASLLSLLFYSLALDEECQQKLYEEVKQFDGNYDYETVIKMPYLESCLAETLRLYNPIPSLFRMASEDYTIG